jgi:pantoate--beta-alanine ligase
VKVARTAADIRELLAADRLAGRSIGLVPTMGAFHHGHLSLIAAARAQNDMTVVSLFVNPAQFGPSEDLARYPRDEARDAATAEEAGADVLFVPSVEEMYPPGFDSWVDPGELGTILEGAFRPGHFRGVATICTKLFAIVGPARAYFGRKDAQQLAVVKQVAEDLVLPLEIVSCPTIRDPDGLALSSRNAYLSTDDRASALALPRALQAGLEAHRSGADAVAAARAELNEVSALGVDYAAIADLDGLTLAAAVRVGSTRLIDNVLLDGTG